MSAGDQRNGGGKPEDMKPVGEIWPEVGRAECLARGAALKWASGVFCRPEQLERLSQYRKRESQRTTSVHTRLKTMVQSYLEGVDWGLEQLRGARAELQEVSHALKIAGRESTQSWEGMKSLEKLREVSVNHQQLVAAVSNLPRLYSVRSMVLETERLVESRRLLEAHARLMDLEQWQDDILWQLHGTAGTARSPLSAEDQELVTKYFSGVGKLVDALGTRGGRVCTVQKCVLPAHPRTRTGGTPLSAPARHHDGPGHCAPPAGALRPPALQADGGLPEGQPPMFTRSPGTGQQLGPGEWGNICCAQLGSPHLQRMLEENVRVALMIGESLRDQTIQMGLYEMENLLNRFREALVESGKERRRDPGNHKHKFYLHYLLASISNCIILKKSIESLQQQQSRRSAGRFSRTPPNPLAALDRAVRRACRLVMDQLLLDLQPFLPGLLTRPWLIQGDPTPKLCSVLEQHLELYSCVRPPCRQRLQEEAQWLMVVEYVRALMQKRLVCRSGEDRRQLAQQMVQDDQQFRELFQGLEGEGSEPEINPLALLPVLAEFVRLKDPGMLILEVSGLAAKYPDISEEHVLVLLDIRGDVSRDIRFAVLDLLEQSAPALPCGYRPIFTDILVPPPTMAFCLPTAKCA
ncbi:exocyst complex component 3-like protein isoform X5 [Nelusetta ayraudi]|uniref:exocyst complex component 3-like protein isoform X5 n=1 Tax=Nelusetta ayraudi TaxID=303726 RepID=UPI003F6FCAD8